MSLTQIVSHKKVKTTTAFDFKSTTFGHWQEDTDYGVGTVYRERFCAKTLTP